MEERKDNSNQHGYWIHTRIPSKQSVTGYFVLSECTCSNCKFVVASERDRCPHCKAIMDKGRR